MIETIQSLNQTPLGLIFAFGLGLIWGSFLNVVIHRLPHDESITWERSRCPKCKAQIPWYLNIPLASYLFLRGRCRNCQKPISIQYPLVELTTGLFYLGLAYRFGISLPWLGYAVFVSMLIAISVIDFHLQIIPDELSLGGMVVGFLFSFLLPEITWWESLVGILLGGGLFLAVAWGYEKASGNEGLGGGDIKLLGMIGAWEGYKSILIVIVISSAVGSIVGLAYMMAKRKGIKTAIPFGPFLALGALIYLFWGHPLQEFLFPVP